MKPRFWIIFFTFLAQFGRPTSIPNHPKSVDFSVQNFEAKKCKIGDATVTIGLSNSTSFCSLGGRGETNKTYSHRTVADYLTTPMGQRPGEFQYAERAQPREKIAHQEIFLSACWASKAQRKCCSTRNLTFTTLGDQGAEKIETENANW